MPAIRHNDITLEYDHDPDTCPLCHKGIDPRQIAINLVYNGNKKPVILEILYSCPLRDCQKAFIARYTKYAHSNRLQDANKFLLRNVAPYNAEDPSIPEEVKAISPDYYEIYRQSSAAEHWNLNQIAGAGYRKALEFLVKDYAMHKNPDKTDQIQNCFLGKCIKDFVDDANVRECASRAAWLGNDEVHYMRKWKGKDISDLKTLIGVTETWIKNNLLTEKYIKSMESK